MIVSVFLRNYKVYKSINYIPISNGTYFSSLIGDNGVGKSSILEAIDSFINDSDWTLNHNVIEKGYSEREPYICPVFVISKKWMNKSSNIHRYLEVVSDIVWQLEASDFISSHSNAAKDFCEHRDYLAGRFVPDENFIFPIGLKRTSKTSQEYTLAIFDQVEDFSVRLKEEAGVEIDDFLKLCYEFVRQSYSYIYLPSDIDFQLYTKIEGETVQALMGEKVEEVVREFIDDQQIREINQRLNGFMDSVSAKLESYEYKKPARKQNLFNQTHFASKVIEAYFSSKVLNLVSEQGEKTPIYDLSSGEKRRAIIDIARAFLISSEERRKKKVILAVDEPEISLHTASCFPQFEKLKEISRESIQVMVTTHWYGFMPIVSSGSATYISGEKNNNYIIDLKRFRDDVSSLRKKTKGSLPSNIELKGINDLVQSVISSVTGGEYKWVVCEGVSDKIYLDAFFSDQDGVVVLPVSGAPMVKKFYTYIYLALLDERSDIRGKVFFLLDTDEEYEQYDAKDSISSIKIRRMLNDLDEGKTKLVTLSSGKVFPPTEIEDSLDARTYLDAIRETVDKMPDLDASIKDFLLSMSIKDDSLPSGLAFDWRDSERRLVSAFFDIPGVKTAFSENYAMMHKLEATPGWVSEVLQHFKGE